MGKIEVMTPELPISHEHAANIAYRAAWNALKKRAFAQNQHTAEELANDGLFAIYRSAGRYNPEKATFSTFAYQKAYYRCLDILRDENWIPRIELRKIKAGEIKPRCIKSASQIAAGGLDLDNRTHCPLYDQRQLTEDVEHVLSFCNERTMQLLSLLYLDGLTMVEVGHHMGITESGVSRMHAQAIQRLKEVFHVARQPSISAKTPRPLSMRDELALRYMEILVTQGGGHSAENMAMYARRFANAILDAIATPYEPDPLPQEARRKEIAA